MTAFLDRTGNSKPKVHRSSTLLLRICLSSDLHPYGSAHILGATSFSAPQIEVVLYKSEHSPRLLVSQSTNVHPRPSYKTLPYPNHFQSRKLPD